MRFASSTEATRPQSASKKQPPRKRPTRPLGGYRRHDTGTKSLSFARSRCAPQEQLACSQILPLLKLVFPHR
jgi:hypothetical protein